MSGAQPVRPVAVSVRGWGWRHAGRRAAAIAELDLEIAPGERVLLLGASGSGKSTLLAGLAGLLGDVEDGERTGCLDLDGVAAHEARGRAGLVLQDPEAQVVLARVGDDVAFGCENLGVPSEAIWPRVTDALRAVGLDLPQGASTSTLSGGQKQRLALAGVLAMQPGLILLDEPTANLDPEGVAEVRAAVAAVAASTGATLVVVEHRVAVWADLVDRVIVLGTEGVLADGPPTSVLADASGALAAAGVWLPGRVPRPALFAEASGEPLLRAEALSVGYSRAAAVQHDIDLVVRAGGALAVTGPNGAGKSSLGLTLGGLLPPLGGTLTAAPALADGLVAQPIRWRSRALLTRIGSVFQNPEHQFLAATVRDELAIGPRALGLSDAAVQTRVDGLLDRLRLTGLARANPFTLSGGEQRRLSVATALATRPRLLLLDEPTFGQDALTWAAMVDLLHEVLREGVAVTAVTHDDDFVAALGASRFRLDRTGVAA